MRVLALESSCDETAVALYDTENHQLWDIVHTQQKKHAEHGGVVPELASRDHIQHAMDLVEKLIAKSPYTLKEVDALAYTAGPGLAGALLVTAALGRSLAFSLGIPALGVHHMEGHLLAPMLGPNPPDFPFVALLVSGGHTLLVEVAAIGEYRILGESVDDAAGEAFDKTARLLGLGYPGGPAIERFAKKGRPGQYTFPRPMMHTRDCQMSFSGLKTAAREVILGIETITEVHQQDIALAFEEAAVDVLVHKTLKACALAGTDKIVIAGGVSANLRLRRVLETQALKKGITVYYPPLHLCTDNAGMIAYAGAQRLLAGQSNDLSIQIFPRWPMTSLDPLD